MPADYDDGPSMLCTLCKKHKETSLRTVWLTIPCKLLRKDKIREHKQSVCHRDAVKAEAMAVAAKRSCGIRACMEEQIMLQQQAVRGALKSLYWLAKQGIPHHTKFGSFIELEKSLGCLYLNELEVGRNACFTSHPMIDDFLVVLSDCVERDIFLWIKESPAVNILSDESPHISNLKQLVVFVHFLVQGKSQII